MPTGSRPFLCTLDQPKQADDIRRDIAAIVFCRNIKFAGDSTEGEVGPFGLPDGDPPNKRGLSIDDPSASDVVNDISVSFADSHHKNDNSFIFVSKYEPISAFTLLDFVVVGRKA